MSRRSSNEDTRLSTVISNNSSVRQKHPGVPDGSDGSDRTSYPLTENSTLPVVPATGRVAHVLLYFVVTFTHHQKDTCVTFFAGAAVELKPFTQCLAMLNHTYYSSFINFQNLCIQFVFSSMYLCIYIATYLHTVYLDWQHAVIVSNSRCDRRWRSEAVLERVERCTRRPRSSQLRDALGGQVRVNSEMHLETEIECTPRCTGRPWSSEFGDAVGGFDPASLEMHFEAVIERVWRCNWRQRLSELRDALGGRDQASLEMSWEAVIERVWRSTWRRSIWRLLCGREARWELRLYSLVNS